MKKMLIDIDDVLCEPTFLDEVNLFLGSNYTPDDVIMRRFAKECGSEEKVKEFYLGLRDKNLYTNAKIFEDAVETLKKLNEKFEIYICSACIMNNIETESGNFFKHKYEFLIQHFPFLNPKHFIFSNEKNIFNVDIQIDDNICHLQNNTKTKILYTASHNVEFTDQELKQQNIVRMNNWKEIDEFLSNLHE